VKYTQFMGDSHPHDEIHERPSAPSSPAVALLPRLRRGAHLLMGRPFRIVFAGQTVGSPLLVGPLEVWEGVRMDVDWGVVDR